MIWKNAKTFLVQIATQKISELELYSDFIILDIAALEKSKSKSKDRRNNILNVLKNLELVFNSVYLNYSDEPSETEESITERTKLSRQRSDEVAKKEKMIDPNLFREYFEYLSPSVMYKSLNKTTGSEESKAQVNAIKDRLANLMEAFKSSPTSNAKRIRNRNHMLEIVEHILEFNQLNQSGQGLKILTSNQMLHRLPISLAQLNAGSNSEKLKNEIRQLLYSLYR